MTIENKPDFETTVYGKWILAGEHAVLRGHPAIIFPVKDRTLVFQYWHSKEEARAEFIGDYADELNFLFWTTMERAVEILDINHSDLVGRFRLNSNIPIGAGMGASAALCVAIGRWFVAQDLVTQENLLEFARQLENLFHNESSGADIAVAIAGSGIFFSRSGGLHPISPQWTPNWYLSFSDKVTTTSRCVKRVKNLWHNDQKLAEQIDNDMAQSVINAEQALTQSVKEGLPLLRHAIELGHSCFQRWGLAKGAINTHMKKLQKHGAMAVKPTGSGDGGFVLSLWDKKPPKEIGFEMIKL